ncbi:hypothetical protein QQP08_004884 [Theobroma cacao]|nr:hypothetical protein QQP08_004884 [Theobroma cacao]
MSFSCSSFLQFLNYRGFYLAPKIEEEVTGPKVKDDENETKVETKPKPEIKPKEETETDATKPQVEAKAEVEVIDVE